MEPDEFEEIVCVYGAVLSAPDVFMGARDIKSLPYPKKDMVKSGDLSGGLTMD